MIVRPDAWISTRFPRLMQAITATAHHTHGVRPHCFADVTALLTRLGHRHQGSGWFASQRCDSHRVRTFIALVCLLAGAWLAAYAWLPAAARLPLPAMISEWSLPLGVVLAVVGALLLRRPARKPVFGDGPLVSTLTQAGFRVAPAPHGWQANGSWKGVPLVVHKSTGHSAGRFGRPWTIVVTLPGQPLEPWPFLPEEGLIVDHRDKGFSVAMADLSRPERMHRLGERLDQLLSQRS